MVSSLIFQKFSGEGLTEPPPQTPLQFFSGFALGLGFALNSQALRALDFGAALDTRALRALDSGFAFNFRLGTLVWPPKWIPGSAPASTSEFQWDDLVKFLRHDLLHLRRRSWYGWAPAVVCTTAAVPEWGFWTLTFDLLTVSEIWESSSAVGWRWRGTSTTFRVFAYSSSGNCESSVDPSPRTLLMLWYAHSYTRVSIYCNGLLASCPRYLTDKLHVVLRAAARMVLQLPYR